MIEVDSSLVDEWESLRDPEFAKKKALENAAKESAQRAEQVRLELIAAEKRKHKILILNQVFKLLRALGNRDYLTAAKLLQVPLELIEASMKEYFIDHQSIILDQRARSAGFSRFTEMNELEQTICDPEAHNDWSIKVSVELDVKTNHVTLRLLSLAPTT